MSIQFACPSCRQPIEVDDDWADQEVSCPFCQKVVVAPRASTWQPASVPTASPLTPPPPPGGHPTASAAPAPAGSRRFATWSIIMTVSGWIFMVVAIGVASAVMFPALAPIVEDLEEKYPDPAERRRAMTKAMQEQQEELMKNPGPVLGVAFSMILGLGCLLTGIVLAILSLAREEGVRGRAIACLVLGALPILYMCLSTLSFLAAGAGG